jgi:hypothetical protein
LSRLYNVQLFRRYKLSSSRHVISPLWHSGEPPDPEILAILHSLALALMLVRAAIGNCHDSELAYIRDTRNADEYLDFAAALQTDNSLGVTSIYPQEFRPSCRKRGNQALRTEYGKFPHERLSRESSP